MWCGEGSGEVWLEVWCEVWCGEGSGEVWLEVW